MVHKGTAEQRDLWTTTVSSRRVTRRCLGKCEGSKSNACPQATQPWWERLFPFLSIGKTLSQRSFMDAAHQRDKPDSLSLSNFSNIFQLKIFNMPICYIQRWHGISFLPLEGCTERKDHKVWWAVLLLAMWAHQGAELVMGCCCPSHPIL